MTLYTQYVQWSLRLNSDILRHIQRLAKKAGVSKEFQFSMFNARQMYGHPIYRGLIRAWTEKHGLLGSWKEMLTMSPDFKKFMKDCYQFGVDYEMGRILRSPIVV
jgi:hypothetical protein